jgi:hypothetical protein
MKCVTVLLNTININPLIEIANDKKNTHTMSLPQNIIDKFRYIVKQENLSCGGFSVFGADSKSGMPYFLRGNEFWNDCDGIDPPMFLIKNHIQENQELHIAFIVVLCGNLNKAQGKQETIQKESKKQDHVLQYGILLSNQNIINKDIVETSAVPNTKEDTLASNDQVLTVEPFCKDSKRNKNTVEIVVKEDQKKRLHLWNLAFDDNTECVLIYGLENHEIVTYCWDKQGAKSYYKTIHGEVLDKVKNNNCNVTICGEFDDSLLNSQ